MILNLNCFIYLSVLIFSIIKICCDIVVKQHKSMFNKQPTLTSIPERNESEEEVIKWVPKKKHEILKAKYKCLKKLFQIYDASVIGILPETYAEEPIQEQPYQRRKRSRRTKTDACAGTTEISSGDVTETENTIATAVIKDLNRSCSSVQVRSKSTFTKYKDKSTQDFKENVSESEKSSESDHSEHAIPYLMVNEKRRPTRFQIFIQRLLGIRRDNCYMLHNARVYAASDNNISNRYEKRRRRGLRFRRSRRPRKIQSEIALSEAKNPVILSYVQSVQKNCLMDTTPRHCPIVGCKMISYGIINYNDHLNLCHFPNRVHVCHYCHEGFAQEHDKTLHENEHIGITKLSNGLVAMPKSIRCSTKVASDTQTDPQPTKIDVPEDKLKKIVSFFDKITDTDQIISEIKSNRYSESNLQTLHRSPKNGSIDSETFKSESDKRSSSSSNLHHKTSKFTYLDSDNQSKETCDTPVRCGMCGESFDYRQLSLHVALQHRVHDKFSKFHSCAGIINRSQDTDATLEVSGTEGSEITKQPSEEILSCEPSTNVIYYTSTESVNKKASVVSNIVQKVRKGFCYKWEPGTKIIRV